ncbi:hypothetical protein AQ914_04530 [Burkholderia pseudomallei]|nr:hypothetical protein AQ914_04530 [Burkholderia pseudomallei]
MHVPSTRDQGAGKQLDSEPAFDVETQEALESQQPSAQTEFAEAQDEMSDVMAQFGRRVQNGGKGRRSEDFERILDSDADEKLDDLEQFAKSSKQQGGKLDAGALLREARQRFGDISDQMLALRELRRRKRLDGEPVDSIDEAMEELMREADPKQLKGGINAALKARVFGKRMRLDAGRLRQLYRQFLMFEGSYLAVYEEWIEEFGAKRRKRILEFVHAALTYDMQSLDPSCSGAAEFGPLLATLGSVRTLCSADEQFVGSLIGEALLREAGLTEVRGLKVLLAALQRPKEIEFTLTTMLAPLIKPLSDRERSEFMQPVLRSLMAVPVTLFADSEERQQLIAVVRDLVSLLYERERRASRMHLVDPSNGNR